MYLLQVSGTSVSTFFGVVCSRQYFSAAASNVPVEEPPRMPSFSSSSRAVRKLSLSLIAYAFLTRVKSEIGGRKSSPMPSTIQLADFSETVPRLMYSSRIEPTGSARISSVCGDFDAKQRDK